MGVELRRRGWSGREFDLLDEDGRSLAELSLQAIREGGELVASDGRRWTVRRDGGFGPWRTTDEGGAELVVATKEGLRERFTVEWPSGSLRLERRAAFGLRRLEVLDPVTEAVVGEVRQRGLTGKVHDLVLPAVPLEVAATIGWLVAMLTQRDAAVAAQQ